jgi:hypothetical protein
MDETDRAKIAEERVLEYLWKKDRDWTAQIAMRVMYRLALIWKIERDYRLIRDPNDPRLAFQISDQHVYCVHNMVAALPPPSQSDALAEYDVMTLLAELEPDRAWLTSTQIYNEMAGRASSQYAFVSA